MRAQRVVGQVFANYTCSINPNNGKPCGPICCSVACNSGSGECGCPLGHVISNSAC